MAHLIMPFSGISPQKETYANECYEEVLEHTINDCVFIFSYYRLQPPVLKIRTPTSVLSNHLICTDCKEPKCLCSLHLQVILCLNFLDDLCMHLHIN